MLWVVTRVYLMSDFLRIMYWLFHINDYHNKRAHGQLLSQLILKVISTNHGGMLMKHNGTFISRTYYSKYRQRLALKIRTSFNN